MANILDTVKQHKWLFAGGAGVAGVGFLYLHEKNKNAASATPASAAAYGYAYGYGAAAYGYGAYGTAGFEEAAPVSPYSYYGYGPYAYGYGVQGVGVGASTPPAQGSATTNAQWAAAAQQSLTNEGFSSIAVAEALGEYITGGTLTADQETIVNAAIAAENYPPVAGASGYPPAMHTTPSTGQTGGGGTTSSTKVTVPNVVGQHGETAKLKIQAAGLRAAQSPKTTPKGKSTTVTAQSPKAGASATKGSTVTTTVKVS